MALTNKLTNIANAIRNKTGLTEPMTLDDMATEIENITKNDISQEDEIAITNGIKAKLYTGTQIYYAWQVGINCHSYNNLVIYTDTEIPTKNDVIYTFNNGSISPDNRYTLNSGSSSSISTKEQVFNSDSTQLCSYKRNQASDLIPNETFLPRIISNFIYEQNTIPAGFLSCIAGLNYESNTDKTTSATCSITKASFPNVTSIGKYGMYSSFNGATSLNEIYFPNLKSIQGTYALGYAFARTNIEEVIFPELIELEDSYVLDYAFADCRNLKTVSFPKLTTIKDCASGVGRYAFSNCTNLTSVSFPKLTTIYSEGMSYMFNGCTNLTSLDLPSLSGDIFCKCFAYNNCLRKIWIPKEVTALEASARNTSSPSYFTHFSPFYNCSPDLVIYTDAPEKLEGWSDYCFHVSSTKEATVVYGATHEDFENETLPSSYPTLTVNIPNNATVNGTYMKKEVTTNTIRLFPNSSITLTIMLDGYYPIEKTYTIENSDITETVDISEFIPTPTSLDLHYNYAGQEDSLLTFVDDVNYKIDNTKSAITNIPSTSDNKTGYYGYVVVKPTVDVELSVTYKYNYYSTSYSYGCHSIYVGSQIYQPTNTQIYNNTKDGNGEYLERGYGNTYYKNGLTSSNSGANTLHTVTTTLNAGITYYINFAATKYSTTYNCGTFVITDIVTTPVENSELEE